MPAREIHLSHHFQPMGVTITDRSQFAKCYIYYAQFFWLNNSIKLYISTHSS